MAEAFARRSSRTVGEVRPGSSAGQSCNTVLESRITTDYTDYVAKICVNPRNPLKSVRLNAPMINLTITKSRPQYPIFALHT